MKAKNRFISLNCDSESYRIPRCIINDVISGNPAFREILGSPHI